MTRKILATILLVAMLVSNFAGVTFVHAEEVVDLTQAQQETEVVEDPQEEEPQEEELQEEEVQEEELQEEELQEEELQEEAEVMLLAEGNVCPHCGQEVTWTEWSGDIKSDPGPKHFRLVGETTYIGKEVRDKNDEDGDGDDQEKLLNKIASSITGHTVIDLNGYTLKVDSPSMYNVLGAPYAGDLAIMDSSVGQTGKITSIWEDANSSALINLNKNTTGDATRFTLYGGTISGFHTTGKGSVVRALGNNQITIEGGTISYNSAKQGGAVYAEGDVTIVMNGGTISNCTADSGGAIYMKNGTLNLNGGTIKGNSSTESGGAIIVEGDSNIYMKGTTLSGNTSPNGGAIYLGGTSAMTMNGGTITENTATNDAGAVYVATETKFVMNSGTISYNSAKQGGALGIVETGTADLNGGTIEGNSSTESGGAMILRSGGTVVVDGAEIKGNSTADRGGVFAGDEKPATYDGTVTIKSGKISENSTPSYGGVVGMFTGTVNIEGGTISGNTASDGSVIYNGDTTLNMTGGMITGNFGKRVFYMNKSTINISGGTIDGNFVKETDDADDAVAATVLYMNTYCQVAADKGTEASRAICNISGKPVIGDEGIDYAATDRADGTALASKLYIKNLEQGARILAAKEANETDDTVGATAQGSLIVYTHVDDANKKPLATTLSDNIGEGEWYLQGDTSFIGKGDTKGGASITATTVIDLRGHTLTVEEGVGRLFNILYNEEKGYAGDLTIKDSVGGGKIVAKNTDTDDGGAFALVYTGGKFTLEGGEITGFTTKSHGGVLYLEGEAEINFNGGKITNCSAVNGGVLRANSPKTVINFAGTDFSGNESTGNNGAVLMGNSVGTVNITDGTFSEHASDNYVMAVGNATVTITGGTFENNKGVAVYANNGGGPTTVTVDGNPVLGNGLQVTTPRASNNAPATRVLVKGDVEVAVKKAVCSYETADGTLYVGAHEHTEEVEAKEANCTEAGYEAGIKCSDCGETVSGLTEIAALGHSYKEIVTEPTCTTDGFTTHVCSVCDDSYVDAQVKATGHNWKDADCDEPKTCSACGTTEGDALGHNWKDADCDEPKTCSACGTTEGDALGHSYKEIVTEPTCTTGGYTLHVCSVCGGSYVDGQKDALGHDYEATVTEPTCTEGGYTTNVCSVCGDTYVDAQVEANGHTEVSKVENNVTIVYCSVCEEVFSETTNVAKIGGNYYETVQAAVDAAVTGDTITLVDDVTIGNNAAACIKIAGKDITLDLNGFTLAQTIVDRGLSVAAIAIREGAALTVVDSSEAQTGKISATKTAIQLTGTLNLVSGTIACDVAPTAADVNADFAYPVWIYAPTTTARPTFNMTGGELALGETQAAFGTAAAVSVDDEYGTMDKGDQITVSITGGTVNDVLYLAENVTLTAAMYAAKVDTVYYQTLAEALAVAEAGQTVTMLKGLETSEIILIDKAITLDGNGMTITSKAARGINVNCAGNVVIENLTITAAGERAINVIDKPVNLTLNNVNATAANYAVNVATSAGAAKVTVKDSELTGLAVVNVAAPGANVEINNTKIVCNDNNANEFYGAITVNFDATNAQVVVNGGEMVVADDSAASAVFAIGGSVTFNGTVGAEKTEVIVAMIGAAGYVTLADAVESASNGATIKLIRDVTVEEYVTVSTNVTLDLNGNTIIATDDSAYGTLYVRTGRTLTITDSAEGGKIVKASGIIVGNYGTVNVEAGTLTAGANEETDAALYNFYYNGTTYGKAAITGGIVSTVWNCGKLNVNGGEVAYVDNSGALAVNGGEIAEIYGRDGSDAAAVEGAGTIAIANPSAVTVPEDFELVEISTGVYEVVAKVYVAKVGEKKFESLVEAVAAAEAGATVKLLASAEGNGIVINKDLTIDFGGNTYTIVGQKGDGLVGSAGTETLGLQILKGNNVTLTNGTLKAGTDACKMLVQNYADLTLSDITVDGTGSANMLYVVSNNCGNSSFVGATSIYAPAGAVAFDVCKYSTYAAPTVTVNTTGTITGKVEVSATLIVEQGELTDVEAACSYKANDKTYYVAAHTEVIDKAVAPTCTTTGLTEGKHCSACGDVLVKQDVVDALGHTAGETVVENKKAATCTTDGSYDNVVYCTVCEAEMSRETITVKALGHTEGETVVENKVEATYEKPGSYDNVVYCTVCGVELSRETVTVEKALLDASTFMTTMSLENELNMMFGVPADALSDWTGVYAKIVKEVAGKKPVTKIISSEEWGFMEPYHAITFAGVAGKEMADKFTLQLFDANDMPISTVREDSVKAYALRAYNNTTSAVRRTMFIDMLNYGAAAQEYFKYNTGNLANAGLTAEQLSYATTGDVALTNCQKTEGNVVGMSLDLGSRILIRVGVNGVDETCYATYSYTSHTGEKVTGRIEGKDFGDLGGVTAIDMNTQVLADARQPFTLEVFNAEGVRVAYVYDSLEAYIQRALIKYENDLFVAIMKFADSAYAMLHAK